MIYNSLITRQFKNEKTNLDKIYFQILYIINFYDIKRKNTRSI